MKFTAEIDVMPRREILDPQGKAVQLGLRNLGIEGVADVRIGKHLHLEVEADDEADARAKVDQACRKLLANAIMEDYTFELKQAAENSATSTP
ncbi:MAG: phosphoribosylformylglycinamidine synthase subunit PurS [Catalinimonas sp.]